MFVLYDKRNSLLGLTQTPGVEVGGVSLEVNDVPVSGFVPFVGGSDSIGSSGKTLIRLPIFADLTFELTGS